MKIIEITPDVYKRLEQLARNYDNVEAFVEKSLKNYLSKKAVDLEKVGWYCGVSTAVTFRDAAFREAKRCESILSHEGRCGWLYKL